MGFFGNLLARYELQSHDGRRLWEYKVTEEEYTQLKSILSIAPSSLIDPRDAVLYYSEWWKRIYDGGRPSKEEVYNSLGRPFSTAFNSENFYELAKRGANILGIKWLSRQYTLYFRTLLLQGGIPIKHVSENAGAYRDFLLRLLDLQIQTVEEILMNPSLVGTLPVSSRNDIIFENCLEIINGLRNNQDNLSELFGSNEKLSVISKALKEHKLEKRINLGVRRPRAFWVLRMHGVDKGIYLRVGFNDLYSLEELKVVLTPPQPEHFDAFSIQVFVEDNKICSFVRTIGGSYKTFWDSNSKLKWNLEREIPSVYCVTENQKWEITNLVTTQPSVDEPTLWASIGESEWRLMRGNFFQTSDEVLIIYPNDWQAKDVSLEGTELLISNFKFFASKVTTDVILTNNSNEIEFRTNNQQFEYSIISQKPKWISNSSLPIIINQLRVQVFDNEGNSVDSSQFAIFIKTSRHEPWRILNRGRVETIGVIEIKIEFDGKFVTDKVYNIGSLELTISNQTPETATLNWQNRVANLGIWWGESDDYTVTSQKNIDHFSLRSLEKIPSFLSCRLKLGLEQSIYLKLNSPFTGVGLIDKNGELLEQDSILFLPNLYGIRLLRSPYKKVTIKMWNDLRPEVIIYKEVLFHLQPLISYKESIQLLYSLADSMNHLNGVNIEVFDHSKDIRFFVKGFSNTINNVQDQLNGVVEVSGDISDLNLYAIKLNAPHESELVIPMEGNIEGKFSLPEGISKGQFIIVSDKHSGAQLQPRFINTDPDYVGTTANDRIVAYKERLLNEDFNSNIWKELLIYYNICVQYNLPFSTFDQIRAIGICSEVAAKAFFFLGLSTKTTKNDFIQSQVTALERDLGFCFHWIKRKDWEISIKAVLDSTENRFSATVLDLLKSYFDFSQLEVLFDYVFDRGIRTEPITNMLIMNLRQQLGIDVINALPQLSPDIRQNYNFPNLDRIIVKLLIKSPIAIAESIYYPEDMAIWSNDERVQKIKRNIQYARYLAPEFYAKVLYRMLTQLN